VGIDRSLRRMGECWCGIRPVNVVWGCVGVGMDRLMCSVREC
jgi:hypothetical protein